MTNINDRELQLDRMRYVKNTASSRLCYLAILLNVFYFVSIYKSDVGSWYYQILIGASIVYNLLFLLMAFLASEGVKSYQKNYSWLLYGLGIGQIIRVFILPAQAHSALVQVGGTEVPAMLRGLESADVRVRDCVEVSDMAHYVEQCADRL